MDLITHETDVHQNLIQFLPQEIPDPIIGGILIGKFNRGSELKVKVEIDRSSSFKDIPGHISRNQLVTIIGNLIDNAMEATMGSKSDNRWVRIELHDQANELMIEVSDSGTGIAEAGTDRLFELGYSTKGSAIEVLAYQSSTGPYSNCRVPLLSATHLKAGPCSRSRYQNKGDVHDSGSNH